MCRLCNCEGRGAGQRVVIWGSLQEACHMMYALNMVISISSRKYLHKYIHSQRVMNYYPYVE